MQRPLLVALGLLGLLLLAVAGCSSNAEDVALDDGLESGGVTEAARKTKVAAPQDVNPGSAASQRELYYKRYPVAAAAPVERTCGARCAGSEAPNDFCAGKPDYEQFCGFEIGSQVEGTSLYQCWKGAALLQSTCKGGCVRQNAYAYCFN